MSTFLSGDEIREKRKKLGLTQKRVTEHLGLKDTANISDWENDRTPVPEKHRKRLLVLLEMPSNEETLEDKHDWAYSSEDRQEFGVGKNQVYLFYNPRDKHEAESKQKDVWACNIGMTTRPVEERIKEQTDQWTVKPVIALIFRYVHNDECQEIESRIHDILKIFGRQRNDLKGREWFDTSPDQVVYICEFIYKMKGRELVPKPSKIEYWTVERFKGKLLSSQKYKEDYESRNQTEKLCKIGTDLMNLVKREQWDLTYKFNKYYFNLYFKGKPIFGVNLQGSQALYVTLPADVLAECNNDQYTYTYRASSKCGVYPGDVTVANIKKVLEVAYLQHAGSPM